MNGQDLHSINQQDSVFGRPLTSDPSSLVHDPTALHPLALSHHHISIGAGAGIGYPDYLSESLKSTNDALHDVRLPSNNSSRTFCERSASQSPRTTGQEGEEAAQLLRDGSLQEPATGTMLLQEEMSVAYDEAGNVLHHHMPAIGHGQSMGNGSGPYGFPHEPTADLDQAYQASPFAFQYDPSAEEYGRAAPMYAGGHSYDMAYMQHMAHMSAHIEDQTAQNASTMSHHIPLGKRRPRTIMISGEDSSEKMYASTELLQHHQGPSAYEDRSMVAHHHEASCYHEPHNDMPHDPQHEMHHEMHHDPKAYPMAMHPSRYYYPVC